MADSEANVDTASADASALSVRVAAWVTHERLDDEVIAINLETGVYFALDDVAADAWTLLAAGVDVDQAATVLAERYDIDPERVRADVMMYTSMLEHEQLVVRDDTGRVEPAAPVELPSPLRPLEYAAPTVTRYDDLEALLRLDPVHEVDEAGWPVMRAD
jgi:hypothetical protein